MRSKHLPLYLIFAVLCACGKTEEKQGITPALTLNDSLLSVVSVDTVHETGLSSELLLNGRITFDEKQVARVFPIFGGTITQVNAETGDFVKKGDILAVIRSSEIADFEKQRQEAAQKLILAKRNLTATREMSDSGMASERDVLQAEQEAKTAEAEQKRLDEVFAIYHITGISTYNITSPVSGFVIQKNISRDMLIRSDQDEELFTISGLDNVWVIADVYESDIRKVKEGAEVRITTLAYGDDKTFTGTIDKIYNLLDNESKTMKVRIKLDNAGYQLKPGMFTNVYVQSRDAGRTMPCINTGAVIFDSGKQYVVRIADDNILHKQEISVYKQNDKDCYLSYGLKEGDRIIDNNALLIYNALKQQ